MLSYGARFLAVLCLLAATLTAGPAQAASKPAASSFTKITPARDSVTLSWKPAAGATAYSLCLFRTPTAKKCTPYSRAMSQTSYTLVGLTPGAGTDYYAVVRTHNRAGMTSSKKVPFDLAVDNRPPAPTGITHTVTSASTADLAWQPVARATDYAVCLTTSGTATTCARTVASKTTSARLTALTPTGGRDYYYTITAKVGGVWSAPSARGELDLPVGATAKPTVAAGNGSVTARWAAAANASAYEVRVARNAAQTESPTVHRATTTSLTVSQLPSGVTYYVSVRGLNDSVQGAWSAPTAVAVPVASAHVAVVTYNLCGQNKCVTKSNGMKSWSSRKALAGAFVRSLKSGIISTQESHDTETRFIDQLPGFGVAAYYKSKTLFYDKSTYALARAGHMTLDANRGRYAVWAELRDIASGARFVVVDPHLEPYKGAATDKVRYTQTTKLLADTDRINTADLPVVWAGDFNSNASNADQKKYKGGFDAPRRAFLAAGLLDSKDAAPTTARPNITFNSANQAVNPPLKYGHHVDQVYVDPRIDVLNWSVQLRYANGRYVVPFASDHNALRVVMRIPAV